MLDGMTELVNKMTRLGKEGETSVKAQAGKEALWVLNEALPLVPVRTGWLKRSGRLREWKRGWNVIFSAPHAYLIHEGAFPHQSAGQLHYLKSGGQKHFLQQPLERLVQSGVFTRYQTAFNLVVMEIASGK